MCSLSRFIVLATLVGVAASSITGSDAVGWLAAAAAVGALLLAERLIPQLQRGSCPVPGAVTRESATTVEQTSPRQIDRTVSSRGTADPAQPRP